jgi:hypothetical protein
VGWGGGEIFRTRPDRPWGACSLLYDRYRVCFAGVQWPGRGVNHPLPSNAEVKERVELYLCSPCRHSWPVLGRTLPAVYFVRNIFVRKDRFRAETSLERSYTRLLSSGMPKVSMKFLDFRVDVAEVSVVQGYDVTSLCNRGDACWCDVISQRVEITHLNI